MCININGQDKRENGEDGVMRGTVQDNDWGHDSVDAVDEKDVGSRKRKRHDIVSPLSQLIKSCRNSNQ